MLHPDSIYKSLLKNKRFIKDLFINIINLDWVNNIDFESFELISTEFISSNQTKRISDIIYKVKVKDEVFYIAVIIEIQTSVDYFMSLRLCSYTSLLLEDIVKLENLKRGDKLPPVVIFVVYDGESDWYAPFSLQPLISKPTSKYTSFKDCGIDINYNLIDLSHIDLSTIKDLNNSIVGQMALLQNSDKLELDFSIYSHIIKIVGNDKVLRYCVEPLKLTDGNPFITLLLTFG